MAVCKTAAYVLSGFESLLPHQGKNEKVEPMLLSLKFKRSPRRKLYPDDGGLKEPVWKFEDTFSAVTVLKEMFFNKETKE